MFCVNKIFAAVTDSNPLPEIVPSVRLPVLLTVIFVPQAASVPKPLARLFSEILPLVPVPPEIKLPVPETVIFDPLNWLIVPEVEFTVRQPVAVVMPSTIELPLTIEIFIPQAVMQLLLKKLFVVLFSVILPFDPLPALTKFAVLATVRLVPAT